MHLGGREQTLLWWTRSHPAVERQSEGLRKVSSTVGGSDTACFAAEHASRGMRRGTRADGTRSTADDRSTDAQEFRDSTGLPLNPQTVKRARELENVIHGRAEGS